MGTVTHLFSWSGHEITLGVLDEHAIAAFTDGDCLTLAWALKQYVPGDIVAVVEHPGTDQELDTHYVIDLGDSTFLDVEGVTTEDVLIRRWARNQQPAAPVGLRRGHMPSPVVADTADIAAAATVAAVVVEQHLQPTS